MSEGEKQAFPTQLMGFDGMTVRTWLVGMAMQGVMARGTEGMSGKELADLAVMAADAVIWKLDGGKSDADHR